MGKSKEAKQVNSDLDSRYKTATGGGRPVDDLMKKLTGAYDEDRATSKQQQGDVYGRYGDIASTGGLSDENRSRIRGNGVFDEFAKTGGLNAKDVANLRSRGGSAVPSFYSSLKDEMERGKAVNNGFNPGYTGQVAKMARDQAHASQAANLDTELGITDTRNKGRMWGSGSLSDAERALAGQESQNRMGALGGMSNIAEGNQNQDISQLLQAMGMGEDEIMSLLGARSARYENKSGLSKMLRPLLGAAGGIGSSLLGGIGGGKQTDYSGGYDYAR